MDRSIKDVVNCIFDLSRDMSQLKNNMENLFGRVNQIQSSLDRIQFQKSQLPIPNPFITQPSGNCIPSQFNQVPLLTQNNPFNSNGAPFNPNNLQIPQSIPSSNLSTTTLSSNNNQSPLQYFSHSQSDNHVNSVLTSNPLGIQANTTQFSQVKQPIALPNVFTLADANPTPTQPTTNNVLVGSNPFGTPTQRVLPPNPFTSNNSQLNFTQPITNNNVSTTSNTNGSSLNPPNDAIKSNGLRMKIPISRPINTVAPPITVTLGNDLGFAGLFNENKSTTTNSNQNPFDSKPLNPTTNTQEIDEIQYDSDGKPIKPKSAFIMFVDEELEQTKAEHLNKNETELTLILKEKWEQLDAQRKDAFEKRELKLQALYDSILKTYQTEQKKDIKEEKEEKTEREDVANKPKRPKTAFMIFMQDKRDEVKNQFPGAKLAEVAKTIAEIWKSSSEKDKEEYYLRAAKEKEEYLRELENFQKKQDVLK